MFRINAVSEGNRDEAIEIAKRVVLNEQGDTFDFKMFSNLSISLIVELSGHGVLAVVTALQTLGWNVRHTPDSAQLAEVGNHRIEGTLQITFREGDGNLIIQVPPIPG